MQVSDGGAALILVSEDGLRKLGKQPSDAIEVRLFICFLFVGFGLNVDVCVRV
jgi:hypothetical protein